MSHCISAWSKESLQQAQQLTLAKQPSWLQQYCAAQGEVFLQQGFPQRSQEAWRYTSVAAIAEKNFSLGITNNNSANLDMAAFNLENTYRLVFVDGVFIPALSKLNDLPSDVILMTTAQALHEVPELYFETFKKLNTSLQKEDDISSFVLLNAALLSDGIFLVVPAATILTQPIHILYLTLTQSDPIPMHHPRHHIILGAESNVTILEEYSGSTGSSYFNNVVTQILVESNSTLNYYKFQDESYSAFHLANTRIHQARDSQIKTYHFASGSALYREDLQVMLDEPGAQCELLGFYYPQKKQHLDYHTAIHHYQSHTQSLQYYKGILGGRSNAVFNGKVVVHPNVQQISAAQMNHNLLLEKSAEINTQPQLEIYADNIRCTHGATIGNIDQNALFYLQSRGIPQEMARHLLLCGFANEMFDRLPDPIIAAMIRKRVTQQLASHNCPEVTIGVGSCAHLCE